MEKITNYQLFSLMVLFQIGTSSIFGFAASAGKDAWISIALSTILGSFIIAMYIVLMRLNPGLTLVEWFPAQFGRWIGTPISWLYPLIFIYDAGRGVADLSYLIPSTLLPRTPPIVTVGLFMLVVLYGVYHGIQLLGKMAGLFLPIIFLVFIVETILLFASKIVRLTYLLPVLDLGWGRVWGAVWPIGITQSFAETIEFAMIWTLVKPKKKVMTTSLLATLSVGIFLASLDCLAISVLGEDIFQRSIFPVYTLIQQIGVGDVIENVDVIGVLYITVNAFFKISLHIMMATLAIQQLTYIKNRKVILFPVVFTAIFVGLTMSTSIVEHIYGVAFKILSPYFWVPLFLVLPGILLIVIWIKKRIFKITS
ncbi:GerAB/ArcD/ProY family transporter [Paenibacillus wynnii]|uniref:Spore gernimation protein n=1 Tax=Paenibacillus wynnii TaxID=268407 RepID=A0A098M870_9BACL|nr:endospore germination permease [Paenibacillus wynnii]KGE17752.1 spore gernimation protein [Paenibacillus wynnii]